MRRQRVAAPLSEVKKRPSAATRLPDPIPIGEIFTDVTQNQWRLGRSIGVGGFGEIYLASDDISKPVGSDARYVIKVEPHDNGPLFVEVNFYVRAAKSELIEAWKKEQKLKHLGMPRFIGLGSHVSGGMRYRFLVLDRFGEDLSKLFLRNKKHFHIKTALTLAIQILDVLEYIHSRGYIHADVKGSNLLLGADVNQVHLLDFGLACHYRDNRGAHKSYVTDERKAHNGTVEYASRDAHVGAASRRGDLEVLGYNLLQWLCSQLPWESEESADLVHARKITMMNNVPALMRACFPSQQPPLVVAQFLRYVAGMRFEASPDYAYVRALLRQGIRDAGFIDDGLLEFKDPSKIRKLKKVKKRAEPENIAPKKRPIVRHNSVPRQPCSVKNINRMTRNQAAAPVHLRSSDKFSWEEVISSHPERQLKRRKSTASSCGEVKRRKEEVQEAQAPETLTAAMRDVMARRWLCRVHKTTAVRRGSKSPARVNPTPAMEELMRLLQKPTRTCDKPGAGRALRPRSKTAVDKRAARCRES